MERALKTKLFAEGVNQETIKILEEEEVFTLGTFCALKISHFEALSKPVKIGQHALLYRVWEQQITPELYTSFGREMSPMSQFSNHSSSNSNNSTRELYSPRSAVSPRFSPYDHSPSSQKPQGSVKGIREDIKMLADMYKKGNPGSGNTKGKLKLSKDPRTVTIILGAMFFNGSKGIKTNGIPLPNPRKVPLLKNLSIKDVFMKAKELYFFGMKDLALKDLCFADSNGMLIEIENSDTWKLEDYYFANNYQYTRHKLYVMYMGEEKNEDDVFGGSSTSSDEEDDSGRSGYTPPTIMRYTPPKLQTCVECGIEFFSYVPGTDCKLPNGGIICRQDPQSSCPNCDFNVIGAMLNLQLFPHLKDQIP